MERWRVVSSGPWDFVGWEQPLVDAGLEVVMGRSFERFPAEPYTEDELVGLLRDADALIVSTREQITRRILEHCPRLKIIAKSSIGVDRIDLGAARELGILVTAGPSKENVVSVAESTIGLIVALAKRLMLNQHRLRDGKWKSAEAFGSILAGKTIGIVGLGRVGSNVARRLVGWDVRILATDPYVDPIRAGAVGAELVPLERLLNESDVVTLHVTATPETRHLVNEERLRLMKKSAVLVNTSRGSVVDERALVRAIEGDGIAAAALDVFEVEPLPSDSPLRQVDPDRLIVTPHSVGVNLGSLVAGTRVAVTNVLLAHKREMPLYVANPGSAPDHAWRFRR